MIEDLKCVMRLLKIRPIGRNDNLFSILSENSFSVGEYLRINGFFPKTPFKQSFLSAAKNFWAIESFTRGVIVQYGAAGKKTCYRPLWLK